VADPDFKSGCEAVILSQVCSIRTRSRQKREKRFCFSLFPIKHWGRGVSLIEIDSLFRNKLFVAEKLLSFGFSQSEDTFLLKIPLTKSELLLNLQIRLPRTISAEVIDPAFNEPYTLHLAKGAVGG